MVMIYYPDNIPNDSLDQVLVGESAGVYKLKGTLPNLVNPRKKFIHMKSRKIDKENDSEAVWLSEKEEKSMPKFNTAGQGNQENLCKAGKIRADDIVV